MKKTMHAIRLVGYRRYWMTGALALLELLGFWGYWTISFSAKDWESGMVSENLEDIGIQNHPDHSRPQSSLVSPIEGGLVQGWESVC